MKIFELVKDISVRNHTKIRGLKEQPDLFSSEPIYGEISQGSLEILLDYIAGHPPVISERLKKLLEQYDDNIYTKRIQLTYLSPQMERKRYWYAQLTIIDVLDEESITDKMGFISEPKLVKSEVMYHPVFCISGLNTNRWFVSLQVAESMLRENITGFQLEQIEVFN